VSIATTWAEDYPLKINGVTVTSSNAQNLSGISGVSGTVSYDASTSTLTLYGATINGYIVSNVPGLKVKVMGQNTITAPGSYAGLMFQYKSGDVTICGTGTLNITSNIYCISYGGGESITVRDCTLNLYGGDEAIDDDSDYGVKLIVDNADLFAQRGNEEPICVTTAPSPPPTGRTGPMNTTHSSTTAPHGRATYASSPTAKSYNPQNRK